MKVAVVGCVHGELDAMYAAIREAERARGISVELVICAGDFQAARNAADLACMACPPKFRDMRTFWRYYAGQLAAPVPTIFVGGNHEASNHLQEIPLGGLVAPNMYFLGNAGVVLYRGLRIAGVSGVYTRHNYEKRRVERPPYPRNQIKSVYHMRKEDVDRLMRINHPVDIFVSHDWPRGIWDSGSLSHLLSAKPFLRGEIQENTFGNPGATQLLHHIQPSFWFSAHIHVKFPALVRHAASGKETRFLALDKVLPKRDFIQILDIPVDRSRHLATPGLTEAANGTTSGVRSSDKSEFPICFDPEWLAILHTEHRRAGRDTPVNDEEIQFVMNSFREKSFRASVMPVSDFQRTAEVYNPSHPKSVAPVTLSLQDRTVQLLNALEVSPEAWLPSEIPLSIPENDQPPSSRLGVRS